MRAHDVMILLAGAAAAASCMAAPPAAQRDPGMPQAVAIEREMQKIEGERRAMFDAVGARPDAAFPQVATPAPSRVDPEALAARYEKLGVGRRRDGLLVFASFSMPAPSLKRMIADAGRAGGIVVLRGFKDGSIKASGEAVAALGQASGAVQVNPNAFTKYRIEAVPAVVLVTADADEAVDAEGCALPDRFVKVAGDVSLAHAMAEIERRSPAFRALASRYARRLAGARR